MTHAHDTFHLGQLEAASGSITYGGIPVFELNDSSAVELPVAIVHGSSTGPVMWIQCASHGNECVGIGALQRLLSDINPETLSGTIIAVPIVNVLAFRADSRMAPLDGRDLNRSYPGVTLHSAKRDRIYTDLVANRVLELIIEHADAVLDCHDGSPIARIAPHAAYFTGPRSWENACRDLAIAAGLAVVWMNDVGFVEERYPGSLKSLLSSRNIPSITIESGGGFSAADIERLYQAMGRCLFHLGMIDGWAFSNEPELYVERATWLRSRAGGIFWPQVEVFQRVGKGSEIGRVTDPFGRVREVLKSPANAVIGGIRVHATVNSGEYCSTLYIMD